MSRQTRFLPSWGEVQCHTKHAINRSLVSHNCKELYRGKMRLMALKNFLSRGSFIRDPEQQVVNGIWGTGQCRIWQGWGQKEGLEVRRPGAPRDGRVTYAVVAWRARGSAKEWREEVLSPAEYAGASGLCLKTKESKVLALACCKAALAAEWKWFEGTHGDQQAITMQWH